MRPLTTGKIYASDDHFLLVNPPFNIQKHRHQFLHLFISLSDAPLSFHIAQQEVTGLGIMLQSNTEHAIDLNASPPCAFLLVDHTSRLGLTLKAHSLKASENPYAVLPTKTADALRLLFCSILETAVDAESYHSQWQQLYHIMGIASGENSHRVPDRRISKALDILNAEGVFHLTSAQVADRVYLSPSRFSHLFKQHTGSTLKSYLLFKQLLSALSAITQGQSVTVAAVNAGFDSPSHLSNSCKRLTGLQPSLLHKVSGFLQVSRYH